MSVRHLVCTVLLAHVPLFGQSTGNNESEPNSPTNPSGARNTCGYSILTEHSGVELGEYGADLLNVIRDKWYSMIPKSTDPAAPPRTAVVDFVLKKHGVLGKMRIEESSEDKSLDSAAWDAIQTAVPFPLPPPNFPYKSLEVRYFFEYNREPSEARPSCAATPDGVYRVGGSVKSPHVLFQPDPEYSEAARKAKRQRAVTLNVTVGTDGLPYNLCVAKATGSGLDEKAVEAVKQWKFEPGTKDGLPVPIRLSVETTFRLY